MALRLTLKPNERILINGCVVRNADRRQMLIIENHADIVREADLLDESEARSPVKEVYYFIQAALLDPNVRGKLVPIIQKKLGKLVPVFHDDMSQHIFEAASQVSQTDFYKAMRALRPVMDYETQLFDVLQAKNAATAAE
ncbi:flagellar biosynthesis repressor FlbT [Sulfitobacter mediterraneus]|jgi:flagellar biosynthesis repressor protein FlbT|uniref:Flagellar protein FlbT n=2 Tax=Sulfitobacter mediterraneus TaxID=83219 RepID=A0A061SJZ2_9RHOB|nr:flagellar biosynthesis repressor FlbT [Sulfitobacter mediterraneus]KAJ02041.1 flagellum biosynthesis protein FlbT [Sulfitobacter mediterraneus]KIN77131.1 FlbT protein [Sulfitobacter mediterraneus KCTC 32188]MBM1312071.1 flagellar biosynthesis repressor FlbT [Sulfitobacter mediterraneus]MBM1315951.1 flagellar biosynthesis repressor FlbT [Sulfitobacter mediterraneus]MBM1324314.1 flagellar biosynthesis repressor FlbT [Sulfitobacter mediterraneus]